MLSFIYRIVSDFERRHHFRPNVLYIKPAHLERLRDDFANPNDLAAIRRLLDMEIVVRTESVHPQVGWSQAAARKAS